MKEETRCEECEFRLRCLGTTDCFLFSQLAEYITMDFGDKIPVNEVIEGIRAVNVEEDPSGGISFDVEGIDVSEAEVVNTIEEVRRSSCEFFIYPAHSINPFIVADLRFIEWMKKVSNPLTDSNSWEPEVTPAQIQQADEYLRRVANWRFSRLGFQAFIEKADDASSAFGITLGIGECNGNTIEAVRIWLQRQHGIKIGQVGYGSKLHEIWLGFVGD